MDSAVERHRDVGMGTRATNAGTRPGGTGAVRRRLLAVVLAGMASGMTGPVLAQPTYHVAPDGSDMPSGGTAAQPWATIGYALQRVPSGALVLVAPGTYHGRIAVRGNFDPPVTVRSQVPYRAKLRHTGTVVTVYDDNDGVRGVHIEGFDIAHSGPGASALVVQVQSMGAAGLAGDIVFRDNILHDSWNNDILKINNGARRVQVLGNLFYNQSGSDEHIDINSVEAVLVEGNVFFNDFAASGRPVGNDTSSFIVIKDSNANDDGVVGARNVRIRRNIFLNWQGGAGANFLLCGEDGHPYHEAFDILVENNLFLDNSAVPMRAAFGSKGCRDVVFRANTVSGDLPASAYAMRLNTEGSNPANQNIVFRNNIWSDPTGTMTRFSTTPAGQTGSFTLDRNLYWNNGAVLPHNAADLVNIGNDTRAVTGDPGLANPDGVTTPWWNEASGQFNGGHARIADVFRALARAWGEPPPGGAGVGQADPAHLPADDLLGRPRGGSPDLGAVQGQSDLIFANGFQ